MNDVVKEVITSNKFVELTYKVIDQKTEEVLTGVDYPLGYIHGINEILAPAVTAELEGKAVGDTVEVPIDCTQLYGERDESLVIIDRTRNVPREYRKVGTAILMESNTGKTKSFLVTRIDGDSITFDGNNPLCGRQVIFRLEILTVRDPSEEELAVGGPVGDNGPDIDSGTAVPIH